jgi:hypothetical protein
MGGRGGLQRLGGEDHGITSARDWAFCPERSGREGVLSVSESECIGVVGVDEFVRRES